MNISFLEIKPAYQELKAELGDAYQRVMSSGWYILGSELEAFEAEFAAYCETKHCIGVGNGLEALCLILRAMNIGPGDEVIVPSNTYIATWLAVSHTGATPVPVEPIERTFNIDPFRIEAAMSSRTRAIMAVHLYGQPADMDAIYTVAEKHGLKVVVDGAHAHGTRYKGSRASCQGFAAGYSFFPSKNLGATGDGGAVITNNDALAEQIRLLRNYGSKMKYHNEIKGYNSRLDELQASFLRVKLRVLDAWNERRRAIANLYLSELFSVKNLVLPLIPEYSEPVWHLFVVQHPRRDALQRHLAAHGIGTLIHYPIPPHLSTAYSVEFTGGRFPVADQLSKNVLSLPMGPQLAHTDVQLIIKALKSF